MGCMSPLPNTFPGANSVGTMAAAKSGNTGCPSARRRKSKSGMKTGTRRAKAMRKSVFIISMSGSRTHRGSTDSTRVAPKVPPRTDLISTAAALTMGTSAMEPGG